MVTALSVTAALLALTGCAGTPRLQSTVDVNRPEARCRTTLELSTNADSSELAVSATALAGPEAEATFSRKARRVGWAIGIGPALERLAHERVGGATSSNRRAADDGLLEQLLLAQVRISAAGAEVDCAGDSVEAAKDALKDDTADRAQKFTVASLAVDAVTGITAGAWELESRNSKAPPIVAIAGGAVGAALGFLALSTPRARITMDHKRNLVRAVWRDEVGRAFAPAVARLLTTARTDEAEQRSPRELLVARWAQMLQRRFPDAGRRAAATETLLGDGAAYDIELLRAREDMLDMLESEVDLMSQEVELLLAEVTRAMAKDEGR